MLTMADILSFIDSRKRVLGGTLSDIAANPKQGLLGVGDRLNQDAREWKRDIGGLLGGTMSVRPDVQESSMEGLLGTLPMPGGVNATRMLKMAKAPRDKTLETAQRNAALPLEKGGLGLAPDNTPQQRAEAMGFTVPFYHGSSNPNITRFEATGSNTGSDSAKKAVWGVSDNPDVADSYAKFAEGATIYPMLARGSYLTRDARGATYGGPIADFADVDDMLSHAKSMYDGIRVERLDDVMDYVANPEATHMAVFKPKNLRSRFAAFDPKKKNSADILAGLFAMGLLGGTMDDDK